MPKSLLIQRFFNFFPHFGEKPEKFFFQGFVAWLASPVNIFFKAAELPVSIAIHFPVTKSLVDDHKLMRLRVLKWESLGSS